MTLSLAVLTTAQPIVGVDFHSQIPPTPLPIGPHIVVWCTGASGCLVPGWAAQASKANDPKVHPGTKKIRSGLGHLCARGHDAGPLIPHVAPNWLIPIIMIGSSSKAEFGVSSVQTPQGAVGVNLLSVLNIQLHCGDPVALPLGAAIQLDQRVRAGMTIADFLKGLAHMLVDIAIDFLISTIISIPGSAVKGMTEHMEDVAKKATEEMGLGQLMKKVGRTIHSDMNPMDDFRYLGKAMKTGFREHLGSILDFQVPSLQAASSRVGYSVAPLMEGLINQVAGGPLGASTPNAFYLREWDQFGTDASGQTQSAGSWVDNAVDNGIDSLFSSPSDKKIPSP